MSKFDKFYIRVIMTLLAAAVAYIRYEQKQMLEKILTNVAVEETIPAGDVATPKKREDK